MQVVRYHWEGRWVKIRKSKNIKDIKGIQDEAQNKENMALKEAGEMR